MGRAEEIRDESEVGALDVGEEQRGTAGGYDATVNLGGLEMRIDLCFDGDKVVVTAKLMERELTVRTGDGVRLGPRDTRDVAEDQLRTIEGAGFEANLVRVQR